MFVRFFNVLYWLHHTLQGLLEKGGSGCGFDSSWSRTTKLIETAWGDSGSFWFKSFQFKSLRFSNRLSFGLYFKIKPSAFHFKSGGADRIYLRFKIKRPSNNQGFCTDPNVGNHKVQKMPATINKIVFKKTTRFIRQRWPQKRFKNVFKKLNSIDI